MKPSRILTIIVAVALIGGAGFYFYKKNPKKQLITQEAVLTIEPENAGPVVATVDGSKIYQSDIDAQFDTLPPQLKQLPQNMIYPMLVDQAINMKLVANAASQQDLSNDPDVEKKLSDAKAQIIQEVYITRLVDAQITDQKLQDAYAQYLKDHPAAEEVRARHILVADEQTAKDIIKQLQEGHDFMTLAKEKSIDPSAKQNGGELGYFTKKDMVPEFADAAFKLNKGQITTTPVKTSFGWHVIDVEDKRLSAQPSFEEVKPTLKADLSQKIVQSILADLRSKATIEKVEPKAAETGSVEPAPIGSGS